MGCRHSKFAPLEARPLTEHLGLPQLRTGDCMLLGEPGAWTHAGVVFELPQHFPREGSPLLFEYAEYTDGVLDLLTGSRGGDGSVGLRLVNLQQRIDSLPSNVPVTFALLQSRKTPAARRNRGAAMWPGEGVFEFELIAGAPPAPRSSFEAAQNMLVQLGILKKEVAQHAADVERWLSTPFLQTEHWYLERTLLRYLREN